MKNEATRLKSIGAIIVALFIGCSVAIAAEISTLKPPGQNLTFVFVRGEIVALDAEKFDKIVNGLEKVTVVLESPGGLVSEALQIGANIRMNNYATMVLPETGCYSVCGLIWVSGARRYMSSKSQIGFHAAYLEKNGELKESGVANAEIGSFLTHLGLRIEAIRFFTTAGPKEMLQLTLERAQALGIEVYENVGMAVVAPDQHPIVDVYVDRFVQFAFLQSRCMPFFGSQLPPLDDGNRIAFEEGNKIVGAEQWQKLMTQRVRSMKEKLNLKGVLLYCVEVEADLRSQRLDTGINGPSFNCSTKESATELAICAEEKLWAKDRALSASFFYLRENNNAKMRKRLLSAQRQWLGVRNSCNGDLQCIDEVYERRLQDFQGVDIPV